MLKGRTSTLPHTAAYTPGPAFPSLHGTTAAGSSSSGWSRTCHGSISAAKRAWQPQRASRAGGGGTTSRLCACAQCSCPLHSTTTQPPAIAGVSLPIFANVVVLTHESWATSHGWSSSAAARASRCAPTPDSRVPRHQRTFMFETLFNVHAGFALSARRGQAASAAVLAVWHTHELEEVHPLCREVDFDEGHQGAQRQRRPFLSPSSSSCSSSGASSH